MDLKDWATHDDSPNFVLIIVLGTSLIYVGSAAVFLGLAGGHATVAPPGLFSLAPSRRPPVVIFIDAILISVAAFPALIVVSIVVFVSVMFAFVPVISSQRRRAQSQRGDQRECCQQTFAHIRLPLLQIYP